MPESGPEKLLLKQYEFLRNEIVQCIYLKQFAVIGMFTAFFAAAGALLGLRDLIPIAARSGVLPLVAGSVAIVVNCFGSLYIHEQIRNRRACSFNRAIEYLLTCLAWKDAEKCQGFLLWENYITDGTTDDYSRPFYFARTMGMGLPLLLLTVPVIVILQVSFAPYAGLTDERIRLVVAGGAIAVCVGLALASVRSSRSTSKWKKGRRAYLLRTVLTVLYVSPSAAIATYALASPDWPHSLGLDGQPLQSWPILWLTVLANLSAVALGFWATRTFFELTSWLTVRLPDVAAVLRWLCREGERSKRVIGIPDAATTDVNESLETALRAAVKSWTGTPQ